MAAACQNHPWQVPQSKNQKSKIENLLGIGVSNLDSKNGLKSEKMRKNPAKT